MAAFLAIGSELSNCDRSYGPQSLKHLPSDPLLKCLITCGLQCKRGVRAIYEDESFQEININRNLVNR